MTFRNVRTIFFLLAIAIALFLVLPPAIADPHPHDGDDSGGSIVTTTISSDDDIIVSGSTLLQNIDGDTYDSKAWALAAPGLPNVAIARCLGSEAWTLLIGGKQKLVLNQVCMAEFYLKVGRYDLAAQSLCNQPEILEEYNTEASCEIDHDFTPPKIEGEDRFGGLYDQAAQFNEHYELAQQQEEEIEYLKEENASIVGRLDNLTTLLEQAPASTPTPIYVQQEPEPRYTDEEFDKIWGLLMGGEEDE